MEEKIEAGRSSHSSDMRSADCQDVGHLNATIKNSFFVLLTRIFSKPDSPTVVAIHGLAQVRIPAKIDVQHD